jgi:hypothetical protein
MEERNKAGCGFLLPAALEVLRTGLVYYSLNGEPVFCLGEGILSGHLRLPEQVANELRRTGGVKVEQDGSYTVTYGIVNDGGGKMQGYIQTRQFTGGTSGERQPLTITPDTVMSELFVEYPALRKDIGQLDKGLSELGDPMAWEMLHRATVGELAKSLSAAPGRFIAKIDEVVAGYARGIPSDKE